MSGNAPGGIFPWQRGLLDTNILIHWDRLNADELPQEAAICTITLAELSAGVNLASGENAVAERARRIAVLQRVEHGFDPIPFEADAARMFGQLSAAIAQIGRTPRRRVADLMIAAVAAVNGLALFTTNPADYEGLGDLVTVVAVARPDDAI
ncbi:hypothetical protein GCM10028798_10890 [Humibacter antri]